VAWLKRPSRHVAAARSASRRVDVPRAAWEGCSALGRRVHLTLHRGSWSCCSSRRRGGPVRMVLYPGEVKASELPTEEPLPRRGTARAPRADPEVPCLARPPGPSSPTAADAMSLRTDMYLFNDACCPTRPPVGVTNARRPVDGRQAHGSPRPGWPNGAWPGPPGAELTSGRGADFPPQFPPCSSGKTGFPQFSPTFTDP
jgi:hypothetical protein